MAGQNPFVYQPHPADAHRMDPREGWFGRRYRTGDIELPPDPGSGNMINAPDGGMPVPPQSGFLRPSGPVAPEMPNQRELDNQMPQARGNYALMGGGSAEQTRGALAGLQSVQGEQYSPFSEFELSRLAHRAPGTVAPGSNEVWQNKLDQLQGRRAFNEKNEMETQALLDKAIAGLHPAVIEGQQQAAMARSLPQQIAARGAVEAARVRGNAQIGAANAMASSRHYGDQMGQLEAVLQA